MLLAELEIRHSRAVAPTRRIALGSQWLPTDPAPGYGGILLGGIVAAHIDDIDPELRDELVVLIDDLEGERRIPQPRMRHRFQVDVVGLDRSRHKLVGVGEGMQFELDGHGLAVPQLLGAVYATGQIHSATRPAVFHAIRKAVRWDGPADASLIAHLADPTSASPRSWRLFPTDERWALQVLGFDPETSPERAEVVRRFRDLIRQSHPDHGARHEGAGQRILELTEARRILTA
ncbi:MAG: J domain-containing protein [Actinomycetota bacterium]|nr:J domain-containing protein [Actinomycetota bacterium]